MKNESSHGAVEALINDNKMVLIYFGSKTCGVCNVLKPKVIELLKKYPEINFIHVDVDESPILSSSYNIFTIPGILIFTEGKEAVREARHISIDLLDEKISRYYGMVF